MSEAFDAAEGLVKLAGLLATFGYMSLRSHLNMLGLPIQTSLGLERWLTETFQFVAAILYSPDLLIMLGAALLIAGFWPARAHQSKHRVSNWVNRSVALPLSKLDYERAVPRVVIAIGCALLLRHLQLLSRVGTSIIVGPIREGGDVALARSEGEFVFLAMVAYCFAATLLYRNRTTPTSGSWKVAVAVIALVTLQAPLAHGMFVRSTVYTSVEVDSAVSPLKCGVLILENSDRFYIWRSTGTVGSVDLVPKDKDISIRAIGQTDVLSVSLDGKGDPQCP